MSVCLIKGYEQSSFSQYKPSYVQVTPPDAFLDLGDITFYNQLPKLLKSSTFKGFFPILSINHFKKVIPIVIQNNGDWSNL
ncbi:hypothetical protein BpHYR1_009376 [Brachionus plicatilis]|uniref:Uncharacterized protein n=1 Tax=Brachionus plicatilis TaxID=10195 RepID=A0A3M7QHN3_BRAPC|nr:hypothetical protein BpHYR1_009376 [Brachionus plicatilis]